MSEISGVNLAEGGDEASHQKMFVVSFVSVIFCWQPNPGKEFQYMVWKKLKPPCNWTIPKLGIGCEREVEAAGRMVREFYKMDPDAITPPMDRYIQLYNKMKKIYEVNFFIVRILDFQTTIRVAKKYSGFSFFTEEAATRLLECSNHRDAVRYYHTHAVPQIVEAFRMIDCEHILPLLTHAIKETKSKKKAAKFRKRLVSLSPLMADAGKSLADTSSRPKYHPFCSETWSNVIKNLSNLGISPKLT